MVWNVHAPIYMPHASQFAFGLKGSCTLLSLAACDVVSKGMRAYVGDAHAPHPDPASVDNVQLLMYRAYVEARRYGLCAANGAANQASMITMSGRIGLPIKETLYYSESLPVEVWVDFLRRNVAHSTRPYPILMQVRNGAALKDMQSGSTDEKELRYHAIAIYGTQTDDSDGQAGGYLCCDGDNPAINDHPVIYNLATLAAAQPVSMIAFDYVR
jgi:hypothetical protein